MIGQGQDFIYLNIIIYTFVLSSNCESVWNVKPSLETLKINLDNKIDNLYLFGNYRPTWSLFTCRVALL